MASLLANKGRWILGCQMPISQTRRVIDGLIFICQPAWTPVACISTKKNKGVTLHMLLYVFYFCFFKHLSFDQK
jgi:hypothetical protein